MVSFLKLVANRVRSSSTGAPSTSAMRCSSVRPSGTPIACDHSGRPSCMARVDTVPSSLPTNTTPGPATTLALPRTVSDGDSWSWNQRRWPLAASNAVTRPSLLRTNTRFCAIAGAAMTSFGTRARHFSLPLLASSAMTWPSSVPTTTRPSPTPGPPDRPSLGFFLTFSGLYSQTCLPVCRSSATTPPCTAAANTLPSATAGCWRTPMRPSPLPTPVFQTLRTWTVGLKSTSSAGSCAFFAAASLLVNQPLTVLQPLSAAPSSTMAANCFNFEWFIRSAPRARARCHPHR